MTKVGESISRVRNVLKTVKEDPFMTDRFIYSLIMKYGKTLIKRESKLENLFKNISLFKELPCVELIEVDKVEACCMSIKTACTYKRSKEKLPAMTDMDNGPLIRLISTLDYSQKVHRSQPDLYTNMANSSGFEYNTRRYYWIIDEYLFIPNVDWEAVRIQAMFDDDISPELCHIGDQTICIAAQDRDLSIPEHLFSEIENLVRQEILTAGKIPSDGADDSQNVMR